MIDLPPFNPGTPDAKKYDPQNESTFRRELGAWAKLVWAVLTADVSPRVVTDANRPTFGRAGRVVYNSDDGMLNIDTGAAWTLPDGTVT